MYSSKILLICLALTQAHPRTCGPLDIKTEYGTVTGSLNGNVREWLGIPFAQPPVGDLRWEPPQPLEGFSHVQAMVMPPACMQAVRKNEGLYGNVTDYQYLIAGPISEDCLTLSIWAPEQARKSLPVLVYIHGGAFREGGTSVPYQNPHNWIARSQTHIVVSIQYRLGMWGYPNSPALTNLPSQNLAFLDQRLAIEWVHKNIESFGGDPSRVAIWGQSAGAISILYYAYSYGSDPLAEAFIVDSGSTSLSLGNASFDSFTAVAEVFGCTGSAQAQLRCLREVDAVTLEAYLYNATETFPPIVDNVTVFADYDDPSVASRLSDLPAILGTNLNEGFLCGQLPDLKRRGDRLTFQYQYRGNFSNISPLPELGAYHSSELPLLFGTYGNVNGPSTAFEAETSVVMQDFYLNFALDPYNGLPKVGWKSYNDGFAEELGDTVLNIAVRSVPKDQVTGVDNCTVS